MDELFSQDEIDKVIEDIKPYWRDDAISREAVISIIEESQEDDADEWMDYPWKVTPNLLMDEIRKLPSVTPKQRTGHWIMNRNYALNLNDTIKVKLTDRGKDIYYHQFDDLIEMGVKLTPEMPKVDVDGYTKFQLWDFIQLYGQHIGMIKPKVIEPIDIVIEGKNLKELDEK